MLEHWLALFGAVLLSSVSQMLLKKSAGKEHKSVIFEYLNPWVISGYFLLAASTICVIFACTAAAPSRRRSGTGWSA